MTAPTTLTSRIPLAHCVSALAMMIGLTFPAAATITVDKSYTFNNGAEEGLSAFYKTGSEDPVYSDGQVTLPPNTYLMGTGLYSLASSNFGVEIILSQTSDTWDSRWVLDTSPGYQVSLYGKSSWEAGDDAYGFGWAWASDVSTGMEHRLAIVVTNNTAVGVVTATFYRDGEVIGSRTGFPGDFPSYALTNLMVGAANRPEKTGFSATPSTIKVNEIRLFHFDEGQFDPATDLLTEPTTHSDVMLTRPANDQVFATGTSIPVEATVHYGTAPFSVSFFIKYPWSESYFSVGTPLTTPPYQTTLGPFFSEGEYSIYALVSDSSSTMASSATSTFMVTAPVICVDRQYTFNSGPEEGLATFYKSGSEAPVYGAGQVTLGPNTYLKGTNLYALAPVDFGVEVIVTQTSDTPAEHRWILDTATSLPLGSFEFYLNSMTDWNARDDRGWDVGADGVTVGEEYCLAIVVVSNPDGTVTETFYRNGSVEASRSGPAGDFESRTQRDLMVGASKRDGVTGASSTPCTIRVNEIRLFHFEPGMFSPSLLLTAPTLAPVTAAFSAAPREGFVPLTVTFTDTSTPGSVGSITSRFWSFGDYTFNNTVSTNVTHTYTEPGTYDVSLVVSDSIGGSSTNTQAACIIVAPSPPTARFVATPTSGEVPLTVTFTDASTAGSSGPVLSRYWDFGDSTSVYASTTNLSHTYTSAGVYDVALVVGDGTAVGTNTQSDLITVLAPAASYREAVLRDGPVAYYEMNDTGGSVATDTMGLVNGTYATNAVLRRVNATFPSLGTGVSLSALSSTGLLTVPSDARLTTSGSFSLEFWYKQTQSVVTGQNHLFRPAGTGLDGSFPECYVAANGSVFFNGSLTSPGTSPFGVWHHLVLTRDSSHNMLVYLDGTATALPPFDHFLLTLGVATSFGGGGSGGSAFEGTIDEVAIYTNVLTPARIAAHRAAATNYMPVAASFSVSPAGGPAVLEVTFTDTSTGAPVYSRQWDFGDGATTNTSDTTVVHRYTVPHTTNTVRLVVSGPLNASTNTQSGLIVVDAPTPPNANFSAAPTHGVWPLTVTFSDTSTPGSVGPILSREWNFGDGTVITTNAIELTHVYTKDGTYGVTLVVSDVAGAGTNAQAGLIVVDAPAPPMANFRAAPTSGEVPVTVTFTDTSTPGPSGPILSRYWDFGDGTTVYAFTTNVIHTYTNAGVYGVTLVVSDIAVAGTNSQPELIDVLALAGSYREAVLRDGPVAYYEMNETGGSVATDTMGAVNGTYAANAVLSRVNSALPSLGTGVSLTSLSTSGLLSVPIDDRLTTSGDFTLEFWYRQTQSEVTGQNHLFNAAATGTDGSFFGCYVTGNGSTYCDGVLTGEGTSSFDTWHHLVFTRDSSHNTSWYLDGTVIAFPPNSSFLLTPGVATSFGGGGSGGNAFEGTIDEIAIYTNVLTPARIAAHRAAATNYMPVQASFNAVPTGGPVPLEVTFTDTSTGAPVYSRLWDFGDGTTTLVAANTTVVHHYTIPYTTNTVRLIVTGPLNSSTNTQADLIEVKAPVAPPTAVFSAAPTRGEAPMTVTFTDASIPGTAGPILSRHWDFGDGTLVTTHATNLTHVYTDDGTYGVTLVVSDIAVAGSNTQSGLIAVLPPARSYREAVLRDAPVIYYEMNETGGTVATDTMGVMDGAYASNAVLGQANVEFPGLGLGARITTRSGPALLTIPAAAQLQTAGNFSVECWYKQTQTIVTGYNQPMRLSDLGLDGSFITCVVLKGGVVYCNGVWTAAGTSPFNVWHHLVLTRDSSQNALWYLDGEVIVSQKMSNILLTPGYATVFGGGGSGESAFEGTMDEIAIYTNVLTPARIAAHYAAASLPVPLPPNPVFACGTMAVSGGVPTFSFGTVSGFVYGFDYRNSLTEGDWVPLITPPDYPPPHGWSPVSTGAPMTLVDTNAAGHSMRFYRLRSANP